MIHAIEKVPKLTLVGAGPGDPELITLKGLNAIRTADVVLFDALVSKEILHYIPADVPALSVGKRLGAHSYTQDEINSMIVEMAYRYGHVVRLKGGDPFVFGRGAEEIEYAVARGLNVAVVPGISSSIAVPAAAGIPVTARGVSESFWVVTGTTQNGAMCEDIARAAQSGATIVVLMGLHRLEKIMECFMKHGRADTPVAVIQNGTLPTQRSFKGTVATIASIMHGEDLSDPGIIVVGEVVHSSIEPVLSASVFNKYQ
jgi:uroporphyrin-III C-methyltransferase